MSLHVVVPISESSQVGEARRIVARQTQAAGWDEPRQGLAAIVVTELAANLARHARDGKLLIRSFNGDGASELEILSVDRGPGMADPQKCLQDGYSTGGSPGTGLGAVRRSASVFDLHSSSSGTVILCRLNASGRRRPDHSNFEFGSVSVAYPGEVVCGDAWRIKKSPTGLNVMVVDGLGHGPDAADSARQATDAFSTVAGDDPRAALEAAHRAMSGHRGAAMAAAAWNHQRRVVSYAGVGNICGVLIQPESRRGLVSHNGTLGLANCKFQQFDYPCGDSSLLVMHSDGLQSRWSLAAYPGLSSRHPGVIAGVLYRDFERGRDDLTVLVLSLKSSEET